jgi:hypothetical protein
LPAVGRAALNFSIAARAIRVSGFFPLVILRDVVAGNEGPFEEAVNLAQFPEDQNQQDRDYEQQK